MEKAIKVLEELRKAINEKDSTKFLYICDSPKDCEWNTQLRNEYDNLVDIGNREFFSF